MKGSTVILGALLLASTLVPFAIVGGQLLPTFVIGFSPTSLSVQQADQGSVYITVTSTGKWSNPVFLSFRGAPVGVSIGFDKNPVQPPPGSAAQSVATFSVDASVPVRSYAMKLVGSSGSDVRNYDFNLQVTRQPLPGDFGISVSPRSISTQAGGSGSAKVTVTSINGFSNPVSLSAGGAPSGVTVDFSPSQITPASGGSASAGVLVSVASYAQSGFYPITLTGSSFSSSSAVMVQHSTQLNVRVSSPQDFTITVNPSSISIQQGESTSATVIVSSVGGFSSPVGLSVSNGVPSGVQVVFSPNPIAPGSSTMSINVASSANTGTFSFQILGTSGSISQATTFTMTISQAAQPSFSLSVSPPGQSVTPGGSTSYAVTVTPVSGSAQPVTLTVTGAPAGVTTSFDSATGTPPFTSTLSVTTTSSASFGTATLSIVGSGGGITHTATVTLTISTAPDFAISVTPASQSAMQGGTALYSLNIAGLNGFNSPVSLSVSGLPSGTNGVFSNPSGTPNFASTLTVTLPENVATGSFTLTVTGSSNGITHVANLVLTINANTVTQTSTTSTTIMSTDIMGFIEQNQLLVFGGIILLAVLVAVLALRGRKSTQSTQPAAATPGTVFCHKCGTQNPATSKFCGKCGTKLT